MPTVKNRVERLKSEQHNMVLEEYTGEELKRFIEAKGVLGYKHRDFVDGIEEYCLSKERRVLSISGLRGVGKTTGVLQAIHIINNYEESVFLSIDELAEMNCLDLRNLIVQKYKDKKFIFIDEITRIKDLINNSGFLADLLCANGKKVIISGTDSLGLVKSESAGLYHRIIKL